MKWREIVIDVLAACGALLIAGGVGLIYLPLGLVVLGVECVAVAVTLARGVPTP